MQRGPDRCWLRTFVGRFLIAVGLLLPSPIAECQETASTRANDVRSATAAASRGYQISCVKSDRKEKGWGGKPFDTISERIADQFGAALDRYGIKRGEGGDRILIELQEVSVRHSGVLFSLLTPHTPAEIWVEISALIRVSDQAEKVVYSRTYTGDSRSVSGRDSRASECKDLVNRISSDEGFLRVLTTASEQAKGQQGIPAPLPGRSSLLAQSTAGEAARTTVGATSTQAALAGGQGIVERVSPAVAVVLAGNARAELTGVGSAVVVRPDGVLLTAYHLLKSARTAQVRLKSGEVYDRVELLGWDERRDVVAVRITASGLPVLSVMPLSEALPGQPVFVVSTAGGLPWTASDGVLSAVRMADEVPGAGTGYRLIQFTAPVSPGSSGGVVVDTKARALGIIVASGPGQNLNFAVPMESVIELANRSGGTFLTSGANLQLPSQQAAAQPRAPTQPSVPAATAPPPPPELSDRERSELLASRDPGKILRAFRTIYVKHTPMPWMTREMLENALQKQPEFGAWGLTLVKDARLADVTIEAHVPAFTFDYHYTVTHQNSSIVLLAGKTHAVTGLDGATAVAKNIMKDIKRARRPLPSVAEETVEGKRVTQEEKK